MFCSNCGNQIIDGERFCCVCGSRVETAAPAATAPQQPVIPAAEPAPFYFPTSAPAEAPQAAPVAPTAEPPAFRVPTSAPVEAPQVTQPAPMTPPAPAPVQPAKKKKKKAGKVFLIIGIILLVLAAAAAAFLLFGKKTVYVLTKDVTTSNDSDVTAYRYKYDEAGRIVKITYEYEILEGTYNHGWEISYEYDDDGLLEYAKFESDSYSYNTKITYSYDDDGTLTGIKSADLVEKYDANKMKVSCDDEGRFKRIAFLDSNGNEIRSWEFKYHENGVIKKSTLSYTYSYYYYDFDYEYITEYNEEGKTIEITCNTDGAMSYRYVFDYDEKGNLCLRENYDSNNELSYRLKIDSTYRLNKLASLTITMENPNIEDGEKVQVYFDCKWSGRTCTLTVDKVKGNEDLLSDMDPDDVEITFEIDKHGNLLEYEICADDEVIERKVCEYQAIKVKRNTPKSELTSNPLYLYFFFSGLK